MASYICLSAVPECSRTLHTGFKGSQNLVILNVKGITYICGIRFMICSTMVVEEVSVLVLDWNLAQVGLQIGKNDMRVVCKANAR